MTELEVCGQRTVLDDRGPKDAAAPPLLLIHGAGHDHDVWDAVAAGLAAAGERVIAPDLPGHGASAGAPLPDIDALAAWVLALADALDLPRLRLAGHSMGSLVALAAAAAAPQRVRGLTLIGSLAPMPVAPFLLEAARDEPDRAHELINKFSFAAVETIGEARRRTLEGANLQRMRRQPPGALATDLAACNAWQGGLAAAARVACPVLLICGEHDRMTPVDAVKPLFDTLEGSGHGARMIVLAGTGHTMTEEVPDAVIEAMRGQT